MKNILILVFSFLFLEGYTQQYYKKIKGRIVDAKSGDPLPFCSVFIKGKPIGTVANQKGEFQLNIAPEYINDTLSISHIGYKNFNGIVANLPNILKVQLTENILNLKEIAIETKGITANEIFKKAVGKIVREEGYPTNPFRLNGFYREIHTSNAERTGVLECAVEIYASSLTKNFMDIIIPQFRKVYDKRKNTDQFIGTKEGHNHLLLLLNNGINLIPLAKNLNKTPWKLPLKIEKITYFNDRLVYVLSNVNAKRELRVYIDLEDYSIYKNELILKCNEKNHEEYSWKKINTDGALCGAITDHQSYEYRKINSKLYPYYSFRRFNFRCYDLNKKYISSKASFSTELLINNIDTVKTVVTKSDKLKKKKGLINRNDPYDSAFWKDYNDIKDITSDDILTSSKARIEKSKDISFNPKIKVKRTLKIGNHSTYKFNRADTLFGSLSDLYDCYDVTNYDLDLDIDPQKEIIKGNVIVSFKMMKPSSMIRLDLFEYLKVNQIRFRDKELKFERDLDAIFLTFDEKLDSGKTYCISIEYEGRPLDPDFEIWASGFMWLTDDQDVPFLQSLCQGYGSKAWWPSKNHLSDEPDSATIKITVPKNLFAVSNGILTNIDSSDQDKTSYQWKATNPINNYNIAVHIGNYNQLTDVYESSNGKQLKLDYYFLKQDENLALEKLKIVPKMLEIYEYYFGAYPFSEDGFKIVQSPYPMEHQSCVAVGQHFDDQLILHETAHEWWGNNVSIRDNAHIWIHEAFATYAESLYIEKTLGYEIGQSYLNVKKEEIHNDHPIVGIEGVNHFHYRIEDKYFKGALMLNTLRHMVGNDELWFNTLKGIQKDFRHAFIDTDKLLNYLNDQLGKNYFGFFNQYLRTVKVPILKVRKSGQQCQFRWENTEQNFDMFLEWGDSFIQPTLEWQTTQLNIVDQDVIRKIESKYLIKVKVD